MKHEKVPIMKLIVKIACVFTLVALFCGAAFAQNAATADLRGQVKDPNGAVIANAKVVAKDEARNFERSTTTNEEGLFYFPLLPPGTYSVTVDAPGFSKLVNKNVILTVGQQAELPVSMKVSGGSTETTVSAEAEMVETQKSSASTTITQQRIDNLPINGRNYIQFVLTNSQTARDTAPSIGAAPTSGLNIGGQRARSNLVNVDGADAGDNSVNGIRSTASQEAVQEFQIITNGYAAEYGRAAGGVVNIVTRGGTNDVHGNIYGYLRNRNIQADNHFTSIKNPAYTRMQAGATLGGPIVRDRTFYFLSYETTRRNESGYSTIGTNNFDLVSINTARFPTVGATILGTAAQKAFLENALTPVNAGTIQYATLVREASNTALNGVPGVTRFLTTQNLLPASFKPLNSIVGNFPVHEGTSLWGARLDHRLTSNNQLMARVNVSPSTFNGIQVNGQNQNFGQNARSRTSEQQYRDFNAMLQDTWLLGSNKINEFRFQAARRGLRFNFSQAPGGSDVAINIPGYAFFGREPFSYVDRVEKRFQFMDNFSWNTKKHGMKWGADFNYIPLVAQFTVNFGGLYNFGEITPVAGLPKFSPVQAYGLGLPQVFVQGVGDPNFTFDQKTLGLFWQDSWRPASNFTVNYGVRYDVEFTQTFDAINSLAQNAQDALGVTQGLPRDNNNIAPRVGLAWDPWKDGKTAIRASYGMFFDHPLLAIAFNSAVADMAQAPQIILVGSATPCTAASTPSVLNLNAANTFQGTQSQATCFPAALTANLGYLPAQQRFDFNRTDTVFSNQNYLTQGVPLVFQPFGFPVSKNFEYAYSHQANFQVEHDFGHDLSLNLAYNFNGGHHLNRPINNNAVKSEFLVSNWEKAVAAANAIGLPTTNPNYPTDPNSVRVCPANFGGVAPAGNFAPAPLVSFFRPGGINPSLTAVFAACGAAANAAIAAAGNGLGVVVPFSDTATQYSNGSSVYHGLTVNLKKRFSRKYEFLASYTWSHAIDDSTDLQSLLSPQNNYNPAAERSDSTFDQRHRFVWSGVYQSGKIAGDSVWSKIFSWWTVAPIIEVSSGRPFNILVGSDRNFDTGSNTDRPLIAQQGQTNLCGDVAVANKFSPTGFLIPACFNDGVMNGIVSNPLNGDLRRNAGRRPYTLFNDVRIARRFNFTERFNLDASMDIFNIANKFNVADVNYLYTQNGAPTAAFDPRQFQFGLKINW